MPNRSRIRQSTSSEEIGVFRPIESPRVFCSKRLTQSAPGTKKNSESIFTVGPPERDCSGEIKKPAEGFGEFLHNCRFCKRRLTNKFFMYGYLGAFCSHQCRDHQIVLDGFDEEIAKDIQMRLKSAEGVFNSKITNLGFSLDFPEVGDVNFFASSGGEMQIQTSSGV